MAVSLVTVRRRLEYQRKAGRPFDFAWKQAVSGASGHTHWALWETRTAWERAYAGEPMVGGERAAWVLARLAVVEGVGLEHEDDDRARAVVAVGHALVR